MNARAITLALGGRWQGQSGMARCPAHDDRTPSLNIRDGEFAPLFTCFAGCDRRDILAELRQRGLLDVGIQSTRPAVGKPAARSHDPAPRPAPPMSAHDIARPCLNLDKVTAVWDRAARPAGTLAERYLRARGCTVPAEGDLRYLPPSARSPWPVMVALVTDFATGKPMTLHFTALAQDGKSKAPIDKPKRLMAGCPKRGGVIRLTADADVERHLGLAEGIETALSISGALGPSAPWLPVWATIDAGNMGVLPVVPGIERLTIFADADDAGRKGAENLAATWHAAGREVFITAPQVGDWNDRIRK